MKLMHDGCSILGRHLSLQDTFHCFMRSQVLEELTRMESLMRNNLLGGTTHALLQDWWQSSSFPFSHLVDLALANCFFLIWKERKKKKAKKVMIFFRK